MLGCLLEPVAEPEKVGLVIGQYEQFHADGHALVAEASRQADRRQPSLRGDQGVGWEAQAEMLALSDLLLGRGQKLHAREDQRIKLVGTDDVDDLALEAVARRQFAEIVRVVLRMLGTL